MTDPTSYAVRLVPALKDLCRVLTAAGVAASLDRATMKVPGAWVHPDTVAPYTLAADHGPARTRVSVLLVAPASGDGEALADLCRLLDKALTVLDPDDDVDTSVVLPVRNNPLPAFRLVVDVEL